MRKSKLFIAAMAIICLFAACSEKEGVYNPKKKITNIYRASESIYSWNSDEGVVNDTNIHPKTLTETWTWDGNKLMKITYWENQIDPIGKADVSDVYNFSYDGKQLSKVESDDVRMLFTYDGKKLKQAEIIDIEDNKTVGTFEFVHDGKKITKINVTSETGDIEPFKHMVSILMRDIMPTLENANDMVAAIRKAMPAGGAKATTTIPIELTWNGDNVSKMNVNMYGATISVDYTFDNKNNPYQNSVFGFITAMEQPDGMIMFNKNNVTKMVMKMSLIFMNDVDEYNFTYTYDGDWPLTQIAKQVDTDEGGNSSYTVTTWFEYAK